MSLIKVKSQKAGTPVNNYHLKVGMNKLTIVILHLQWSDIANAGC
jgi:hypothetical protein